MANASGSVDVDEPRDQPAAEPERAPQIPASTKLSPLQEAWGAYVEHATHCPVCRSPDAGRCDEAEELYRAYEQQGDAAYRKLGQIG